MKNWFFLGLIIVSGLIQATILYAIDIFGVKPDLLLIGVVCASIFLRVYKWVIPLSIFAGILKDVLSMNPFGVNTLLFSLTSVLVIKLSKKISLDNNFIKMALMFLIVFINDIIARLIFIFLGSFISWGIFLRTTIMGSLYTALVLPLVLKVSKPLLYS
jgi:rod shape-determining protein MreD